MKPSLIRGRRGLSPAGKHTQSLKLRHCEYYDENKARLEPTFVGFSFGLSLLLLLSFDKFGKVYLYTNLCW